MKLIHSIPVSFFYFPFFRSIVAFLFNFGSCLSFSHFFARCNSVLMCISLHIPKYKISVVVS